MVTIKDVAKLANVSIATVSRSLAEPAKVSDKTREKVMRAVESSGYVANVLAQNFRRRRSNTVVVLVPDIANPFFANIIKGIEQVARRHQYRVLLGDTQGSEDSERAYGELAAQKQADGVICLGRSIPFPYRKGRKSLDPDWPPFVMACEYHGEIPVPAVCIDNVAAAQEAVAHLLALGHRDIAYINGPKDSILCEDRFLGYSQGLRKSRIRLKRRWVVQGDFTLKSGYAAMKALLVGGPRPTAVFCANDEMAIGAMQACRDEGLELPSDMSIVGFDDIVFAQYTSPRLTTIQQPSHEIGESAMMLMLGILTGEKPKAARVILPYKLELRESTVAIIDMESRC
jgi:LacI family repressor for deo operon, udp, cdd, tsx, nupC, and nupG